MGDVLPTIDDVRREEVEVWDGRRVWVWGLTFGQFLALQREAHRPGPDGIERFDPERYAICRLIECVRDSGDPSAKPIFRRERHYEWLRERSAQSIERLLRLSMRLSGGAGRLGPSAIGSAGSLSERLERFCIMQLQRLPEEVRAPLGALVRAERLARTDA